MRYPRDVCPGSVERMRRFVGLRASVPAFVFRARASDWRALAPDEQRRIDAIYGDLASEIAALPDCNEAVVASCAS